MDGIECGNMISRPFGFWSFVTSVTNDGISLSSFSLRLLFFFFNGKARTVFFFSISLLPGPDSSKIVIATDVYQNIFISSFAPSPHLPRRSQDSKQMTRATSHDENIGYRWP